MKYITIVAHDYEEAAKKAREQYGDAVRIHSRREVTSRGGFLGLGKKKQVEITCFLVEKPKTAGHEEDMDSMLKEFEAEAKTPPPPGIQEAPPVAKNEPKQDEIMAQQKQLTLDSMVHRAQTILVKNDFSPAYQKWFLSELRDRLDEAYPAVPTDAEFEILLLDLIVGDLEIDYDTQNQPPRIFVLLGPTGIGKTTTIAKIAAMYGVLPAHDHRKKVEIITLDTYRVGAQEQITSFGQALGIPVHYATDEKDFAAKLHEASTSDLILIDTIGKSPKDVGLSMKMRGLLSVPDKTQMRSYLAVSATMKEADIIRAVSQFESFSLTSMIITKTDETDTIGNIISVCHEIKLPLLFITDGQKVPMDIHRATHASFLSQLHGFTLDFTTLFNMEETQV